MELDKSLIGLTGEPFTVEVEMGHIRKFAVAIGDDNPLYHNQEVASQSAYSQVVAPLTFPIALGSEGNGIQLELDERRMLHGEQEFIYHKPIGPGDCLHCQMKVADVYEKEGKSGPMQFLVLDTEMRNGAGNLVVVCRSNIVYRQIAKG